MKSLQQVGDTPHRLVKPQTFTLANPHTCIHCQRYQITTESIKSLEPIGLCDGQTAIAAAQAGCDFFKYLLGTSEFSDKLTADANLKLWFIDFPTSVAVQLRWKAKSGFEQVNLRSIKDSESHQEWFFP